MSTGALAWVMASHEEMSRSFGSVAAVYQAGRPDYPVEAAAWMLEPAGERPRVADIGAGTGKLTGALVAAGAAEVIAVDPDADMLAELRRSHPGVPTRAGTGEQAPFDDGELDAAVFGQSWHWVDPSMGSTEIARVLRPGGVLGLIWNVRDDRVPWVQQMSNIMQISHGEAALASGAPDVREPFVDLETRRWEWSVPRSRDELFVMARSRSYIITASEEERARIEKALGELFDEIGAVGDARVDLPYVTSAFRAVRPAS